MKRKQQSIEDLIKIYLESAIGHAQATINPKAANKCHDKMHAAYKILRETPEGRKAISNLMSNNAASVRCWAAAHCLAWYPDKARQVLTELQNSNDDWAYSFSAEMTLKEFEKGTLSFDY